MRKLRSNILFLLICTCVLNLMSPAGAGESNIRVALYVDRGASVPAKRNFSEVLDNADHISYDRIYGEDIAAGTLKNYDALIVPGGSASKDAFSMGPDARDEVRRFVREGGIYMGVCAGAYLSSEASDNYLGLLPIKTLDQKHWYRVSDGTPVDVELTPGGMEVFGVNRSNIQIVYENGPIFAPPSNQDDSLTPLGFFRSEVVADGGERGVMLGAPAMILSRYGRGIVLAISPHPEKTPGLKQMIVNALFWLYDHRDTGKTTPAVTSKPAKATTNAPVTKSQTAPPASSALGLQALNLAESIFDQASVVRYVHRHVPASEQVFTDSDGTIEARTDCSGFISYIVHAVAPRHYSAIRQREPDASYPQAEIWARFFNTLDSTTARDGWLAIPNWENLEPGDFIAWEEGNANSTNTGHVMMVVSRPSAPQQSDGVRYVEIPVIDSSTCYHFAPEHLPPKAGQDHRNGLGVGCIRIVLSADDRPIGYWAGTYWGEGDKPINGPTQSKLVRFARMVSLITDND